MVNVQLSLLINVLNRLLLILENKSNMIFVLFNNKQNFKKIFLKHLRRGFLAKTQILNTVERMPIRKINVPK